MTNTTARTPGPWFHDEGVIYDDTTLGRHIAHMVPGGMPSEEVAANAAFIVRAANSHDELLAALDGLLNVFTNEHGRRAEDEAAKAAARAALAKARQP